MNSAVSPVHSNTSKMCVCSPPSSHRSFIVSILCIFPASLQKSPHYSLNNRSTNGRTVFPPRSAACVCVCGGGGQGVAGQRRHGVDVFLCVSIVTSQYTDRLSVELWCLMEGIGCQNLIHLEITAISVQFPKRCQRNMANNWMVLLPGLLLIFVQFHC